MTSRNKYTSYKQTQEKQAK